MRVQLGINAGHVLSQRGVICISAQNTARPQLAVHRRTRIHAAQQQHPAQVLQHFVRPSAAVARVGAVRLQVVLHIDGSLGRQPDVAAAQQAAQPGLAVIRQGHHHRHPHPLMVRCDLGQRQL